MTAPNAPTLYTKHQGLANAIAREFYIPGAEMDDVHQEARIGLWIAARNYQSDKGASFTTFARLVIRRRLATIVRSALRPTHQILTAAVELEVELAGGPDVERVVIARETLARLVANRHQFDQQIAWRDAKRRQRHRQQQEQLSLLA